MQSTLVINPLERTCTEVLTHDGQSGGHAKPEAEPVSMSVRQLAGVHVFVLLGEPGMGKSETMRALAAYVEGKYITVNDFIVVSGRNSKDARPVLIDALDEARAGGDTTVWRELRKGIAQAQLTHFGIACRSADWYASDREDLATLAQVQTVRVFSLDALTTEQRDRVLVHEGIQDVESFERQAQRLGFADMLANPQLLKLLAAAVKKSHQDQWPQTRSEAYELACQELVKDPNVRHQQAQKKAGLHSYEVLIDAAGWLCALMLLSNRNGVSDETPDHNSHSNVWLLDVLDVLPENRIPDDAVKQVLRRPLYLKPNTYVCAHRTVAEYLAARYIAKRIAEGLLSSRVASLMLASPQHLVKNLRGLAGWLAALCEPMRASIFEADPAAVLNYGDLHLLPTVAKQALIAQLAIPSRTRTESSMWQQAPSHLPLVQADMRSFVTQWFAQFQDTVRPTEQQTTVAHILLNALECAPAEPFWEATLLGLLRDARMTGDMRRAALEGLQVHASSPAVLLALLEDVQRGDLGDPTGELADSLLQGLYPNHLGPARVLRFLNPKRHRLTGRIANAMFWSSRVEKATPDELLPEFMAALEQAIKDGLFNQDSIRAAQHELEGLAALAVKAIETHGASIPVVNLSRWLWMCLDWDTSPFKPLNHQLAQQLGAWLEEHTELIKPVMACWVQEGTSSWVAQNRLRWHLPTGMGAFWLQQVQEFVATQEVARAKDCLDTAMWCLIYQPDSGITLDDVVATAAMSGELKEALDPMLVSSLGDENWQRKGWIQDRKSRERAAAKNELDNKNLRYLLDHLPDVRSGKLLNYLSETAWVDLKDSGYGGHDADLLAQWRKDHPELDEATRQGYRALLFQLSTAQANSSIESRAKKSIWHFELPCLVAAHDLYGQDPQQLLQLGKERIQALVTLYLLHHVSSSDWLLALMEAHPNWVEEVWWQLSQKALRSKTEIRIPHLWLLAREPRVLALALRLLPRLLATWPAKSSEANFAEFAQLLEATIKRCPPTVVSELVSQRLQKKSLSSLQKAYLVMAGLWTDPLIFAPMVDNLLLKKQIAQSELLGFIGYLRRYGDRNEALPRWNAATMGQLFKLFGPLCPSAHPLGVYSPSTKDDGRDFLYQLLAALRADTSDEAEGALRQLSADPVLSDWKGLIEDSLSRQRQSKAEQTFALPNARQVALTLLNKTPANPGDLVAVAWDALGELQKTLNNSSTNVINRFWNVDSAGKRPIPPHRPEPECRNVIADILSTLLSGMDISVSPEHQHGAQNQSDIVLRVQSAGKPQMLLPIEVKGDWNKDLWRAPYEQLAKKYASDPHCREKGIYLVLWLGSNRGESRLKPHPNHAIGTARELQVRLQQESNQKTKGMDIRVFVLDISIANY